MINPLDNSTIRGVALSLLMGAIGFGSHQAIESVSQAKTLEAQSLQIQKLFEGQAKTQTEVQDLSITTARMEGKIDVLNQKIDDDRQPSRR